MRAYTIIGTLSVLTGYPVRRRLYDMMQREYYWSAVANNTFTKVSHRQSCAAQRTSNGHQKQLRWFQTLEHLNFWQKTSWAIFQRLNLTVNTRFSWQISTKTDKVHTRQYCNINKPSDLSCRWLGHSLLYSDKPTDRQRTTVQIQFFRTSHCLSGLQPFDDSRLSSKNQWSRGTLQLNYSGTPLN